ncbi:Telomere repeats-binding bouquet formation protein 1 [Camelus dromedarius]|uniref:Telomere repeats-binding bouquet formation protein 1 n=1 Tax=Camelus dromedarius TaxID=9838 RepID=A0A5N4DRW3_CAMDR|nr:Telomere repeats-binding bouquet formation protein 1 [Camelus dromedarius]
MFVKNLAKSSEHSMVKEAALYTLGAVAEQNAYIQKYFISVGGLDVLSQVLVQLESDSHETLSSAKLAVVVTKTVDACIADNPTFGAVLSKYHIVSKLLALLLHESLDSGEKFSIILTLGHCTEDCEENQYDLFKNNGLPLMIQALTESQNEELNKAATFVLHNCKKIIMDKCSIFFSYYKAEKLSLSLGEYSFDENEVERLKDINMKEKNLEEYWKKAKEILHRIEQLEREGNEYIYKFNFTKFVIIYFVTSIHHCICFLLGCIAVGKSLNSRNFSKLLHSCPYQCDRHKVIVEAEDTYKSELRKSLICNKKILLTPRRRQQLSNESTAPGGIKKRRIRKNFTEEEVNYLFNGVKKMGNHWNLILWSFPFQQGRKAVDLAHKYHKLIKRPKCAAT